MPDEKNVALQQDEEKIDISIEGDVDVEIVDDTPSEDRGRKPLAKEPEDPTDEELSDYSDKVKGRIKELTHARHDERRAKEAVFREKQELENVTRRLVEDNKRLRAYTVSGEKAYAVTLKSAAEAEYEMAKKQYKESHEAFDTDGVIAAQEAMMSARMKLEQAKSFTPPPLQEESADVYIAPTEPQVARPDEQTLKWQQRNQWFGEDDEMTAVALAHHRKLVTSGVDPRSDEYFKRVDTRMRSLFPSFFGDERPSVSEAKRPASVVAPATRSVGARKVTLTTTQVALAKKLGVPLELYAKQIAQEAQNER